MSSTLATSLDLRQIPPPSRHALIFSTFEALLPGQALELVNDHDPRPLNAQLGLRAPGQFSWQYVESGPAIWRVQIGKIAPAIKMTSGSCCGSCGGA